MDERQSISDDAQTTKPYKDNTSFARAIGVLLALIGSFIAIGAGVYVTHSGEPLWALILTLWMIQEIGGRGWRPAFMGLVMFIATVGIAVAIYFLHSPQPLWALILVVWLSDDVVDLLD